MWAPKSAVPKRNTSLKKNKKTWLEGKGCQKPRATFSYSLYGCLSMFGWSNLLPHQGLPKAEWMAFGGEVQGAPGKDHKSHLIPKEAEENNRRRFSSGFVLATCRPHKDAAQGVPWGLGLRLLALPWTTASLQRAQERKQKSLNPSPTLFIPHPQNGLHCNPPSKNSCCCQ